jgi:hypothetical protein
MNNLFNKTDREENITKCRKATNPKVYKSINVLNDSADYKKITKRILGETGYTEYDRTTQIVALPGGIKRDKYKIKDDQKFINKTNQGHIYKIMRDYNSNLGCLGVYLLFINIF